MEKFKLHLLDANVVIHLFKLGIWDKVVEKCEIYLSSIVAEIETRFFETEDGQKHDIDLNLYISKKKITVFSVPPSELKKFADRFDPIYFEKLDPGETESIVYLLVQSEEYRICSADKIVYRVLGNLDCSEQGISLEEILQQIGLSRSLPHHFTKKYREKWTRKGFEERMHGIGLKGKV